MSDLIDTSENNVGVAPLPPARKRTKPTVIRPASKTQDVASTQQAPPPRPAPPAPPGARPPPAAVHRPPPPPAQRPSTEAQINKPGNDQQSLNTRNSVNGSTSPAVTKSGSVKKKLEITIVDARPMSEAGFRDMKGGLTSPSLSTGNEKSIPKPEVTGMEEQEGPPKPSRVSIIRPALKPNEIIPPPKPSRPEVGLSTQEVAPSTQQEHSESLTSKENDVPPRPMRPTIIRPQSQLHKSTDQKPSEQPPMVPQSRPKASQISTDTIDPLKLSPSPRPRSTVFSSIESNKPSSSVETKSAPVPSPRPTPRVSKDVASKPEISTDTRLELSQKTDSSTFGLQEKPQTIKPPLPEPPQRPKRPSAQPKPNPTPKQDDDFNDVGPLYAKIVKPSKKSTSDESPVSENNDITSELGSHFQVKLRSTTSVEEASPTESANKDSTNQRHSQAIDLPKPVPKPKPLSRSDSGKAKIPEAESVPEDVFNEKNSEAVLRPKSNVPTQAANNDEIKPGHISEHFLSKFEHTGSSDDSQLPSEKYVPPLPVKRPVTFIGAPQRNKVTDSCTDCTDHCNNKTGEDVKTLPEIKDHTQEKPMPVAITSQGASTPQGNSSDMKKPARPSRPSPPSGGGSPQPLHLGPSVDPTLKQQPSLSEEIKPQRPSGPSPLLPPAGGQHREEKKNDIASNIKEKPASKAAKPVVLPRRPGPGHPLYHYMSKEPHGIAVHGYTARQEDELSFKVGDTVLLVRKEDEHWLVGKFGGKEGLFPANYVQVKCPLPEENSTSGLAPSTVGNDIGACAPTNSVKGPRCKARFDFDGEGDGDLALEDGDVVQIIERVGTEWLRGEKKGRRGIFPVSFVEIIEDLPSNEALSMPVTAIADFNGQEGELSFSSGDTINVLSQVNNEWLQGEFQGKKGRFPASFVSHIPINLPEYRPYKKPQTKASGATSTIQGKQLDLIPQEQTFDQQPQEADELISDGPVLVQRSKETVKGYCRGRFDYLDPPLGDLGFKAGDRIEILEFYGEDWARGRLGKKEGMIPLNLVAEEIIEPDIIIEPEVKIEYGKVIHDFQGETENDLSLKEGDVIEMEEIADTKGNWRWGRLNGKRGMFPVIFVELLPK
nr:SH3 domain-containing protein 19-like isoform X1 [Biomphalaria glabrata]